MTKNTKYSKVFTAASVVFLVVLFFVWYSENDYVQDIKNNSEYRYTIVKVTDTYYQGEVNGKQIEYSINGTTFRDHCGDNECRKTKIGDRYFIKVYLKDPRIWEIEYSMKITRLDSTPIEGWVRKPIEY